MRPIDDECVLEKARSNLFGRYRKKPKGKLKPKVVKTKERKWQQGEVSEDIEAWGFTGTDVVLVAEIPKAAGRWNQANFDKSTFSEFFGATPGDNNQRILLRNVKRNGHFSDIEIRPSISVKSQNYRFELKAAAGLDYPVSARPIGIFIRVSVRMFLYVLAMPTDSFYKTVRQFLDREWEGRADRMKRICSTVQKMKASCTTLPFWKIVNYQVI